MNGIVKAIFISPAAGAPMQEITEVKALAGRGLQGDRYATGEGSFNKGRQGARQVTLMNSIFFEGSGFKFKDSRRNIFVEGVELMWLFEREFQIGTARFRGVKYCPPCDRPSKLSRNQKSFKRTFFDRGGLIAEVINYGFIKVGDLWISPQEDY